MVHDFVRICLSCFNYLSVSCGTILDLWWCVLQCEYVPCWSCSPETYQKWRQWRIHQLDASLSWHLCVSWKGFSPRKCLTLLEQGTRYNIIAYMLMRKVCQDWAWSKSWLRYSSTANKKHPRWPHLCQSKTQVLQSIKKNLCWPHICRWDTSTSQS